MPVTGVPEVMASAAPWATVYVTSVVTNGGMASLVTASPCTRPTAPVSASVQRTASGAGSPALTLNQAASTTDRPSRAPTDRSIPPVRMTSDSPTAMTPYWARSAPMFCRLTAPANAGLATASATNTSTHASTTPTSGLSARRRSSGVRAPPGERAWSLADAGAVLVVMPVPPSPPACPRRRS